MNIINRHKENSLSWKYLTSILIYNTNTGIFTNKVTRNSRAVINKISGYKDVSGYTIITINKHKYLAHRLAWFYVYKKWPKNLIDHIDNNKSNNIITNLRDATHNQNNIRNINNDNRGVYFYGGKWVAYITHNKKKYNLGGYIDKNKAIEAYNKAAKFYHKEFAILNNSIKI